MPGRVLVCCVAALASILVLLVASPARADLQLDGRWRQGPLREDFTVQQWMPSGCGPTPESASSGGGEIIAIRMEGDELAFVGGGRVFRSNQCYDQMPTLVRETHSRDASGKTWRTRCTTPPNDPRKAILNTLVVAQTDTHIDMIETGRYEIVLSTGSCVADVKRTRTYNLVPEDKPATPAAPAPAPTREPPPKPLACDFPGDPTRLEVRPSKKLLRTGESFQFRAAVLDDRGCATRTPTTWKAQPSAPAGVSVDGKGLVTIAGDAPEGIVEITVSAAGKETRVNVEVTSPARYDALLAGSGLNASGESDAAASVAIGSSSIGAGESRIEDRAKTRRLVFVGVIAAVLVLLGALAVILRRRSRRAAEIVRGATDRHETEVAEALERRRLRHEQHAAQMRAHEESLAAAARAKAQLAPASPAAGEARRCPRCGRDFKPPTTFCPHDGVGLVPAASAPSATAAAPAGATQPAAPKRGKICPTCGDRFDGQADYCGKDGTALVLLN